MRHLLPKTVLPRHYEVRLVPDLKTFTFTGTLKVDVSFLEDTKEVTVHARDLSVSQVSIQGKEHSSIEANKFQEESVTISFGDYVIPKGDHTMDFTFAGEINNSMAGLYRTSMKFADGTDFPMAVTQFEPTDARRCVPCWDEPCFKASWAATLSVDPAEATTVLGNMPVASDHVVAGRREVVFEATPPMSSYLLAFVMGHFDHVEGVTKNGAVVRVYTPQGKSSQGTFALRTAVGTLDYFADFYDIPYALPKCDMVAIADFAAGAMENWGLITYRETALLIDEATSPSSSKQRVAYVVAHELAHQWFGNLVTMNWWSELWLNEGFATYVGTQASQVLYPQWDSWTQFVSDYSARAMGLDAMVSSHAIEVECKTSSEINEIFDAISYCKGAAVIRYVVATLGHEAFQRGIRKYLQLHKFSNATTANLWNAMEIGAGWPKGTFSAHMANWTSKVGFPLVSVAREGNTLTLTSQRFLRDVSADKGDTVWPIRISAKTAANEPFEFEAFGDGKNIYTITLPDSHATSPWILMNSKFSCFFRTMYDSKLGASLADALRGGALCAEERILIQQDLAALSSSGQVSTVDALTMYQAYQNESSYSVWTDLASNLGELSQAWAFADNECDIQRLKKYRAALFAPTAKRLGFVRKEDESDLDDCLRALAIGVAANAGDEALLAECRDRFARRAAGGFDGVSGDVRGAVYTAVVKNGGAAEWGQVKELWTKADMHEEKMRCLKSLACSRDGEVAKNALEWAYATKSEVRSSDAFLVIGSVSASSAANATLAWKWLQENWAAIEALYKEGQFLMGRVVGGALGGHCRREVALEAEAFFAKNPCPSAARALAQSLESIRSRAAWYERDKDAVAAYLQVRSRLTLVAFPVCCITLLSYFAHTSEKLRLVEDVPLSWGHPVVTSKWNTSCVMCQAGSRD